MINLVASQDKIKLEKSFLEIFTFLDEKLPKK
jgi:hypothetical protein